MASAFTASNPNIVSTLSDGVVDDATDDDILLPNIASKLSDGVVDNATASNPNIDSKLSDGVATDDDIFPNISSKLSDGVVENTTDDDILEIFVVVGALLGILDSGDAGKEIPEDGFGRAAR